MLFRSRKDVLVMKLAPTDPCGDACRALVEEGNVLAYQNKLQQAYDKYKQAIAAAPRRPGPRRWCSTIAASLRRA